MEADDGPHVRGRVAVALDVEGVPVGLEWYAHRDGRDEAEDVVDDDYGEDEHGGAAGAGVGDEQAHVEEEDGDLAEGEAELVEEGIDPCDLKKVSGESWIDTRDGSAWGAYFHVKRHRFRAYGPYVTAHSQRCGYN